MTGASVGDKSADDRCTCVCVCVYACAVVVAAASALTENGSEWLRRWERGRDMCTRAPVLVVYYIMLRVRASGAPICVTAATANISQGPPSSPHTRACIKPIRPEIYIRIVTTIPRHARAGYTSTYVMGQRELKQNERDPCTIRKRSYKRNISFSRMAGSCWHAPIHVPRKLRRSN